MGVLESQLSAKFCAISQLTVEILPASQLSVNPIYTLYLVSKFNTLPINWSFRGIRFSQFKLSIMLSMLLMVSVSVGRGWLPKMDHMGLLHPTGLPSSG